VVSLCGRAWPRSPNKSHPLSTRTQLCSFQLERSKSAHFHPSTIALCTLRRGTRATTKLIVTAAAEIGASRVFKGTCVRLLKGRKRLSAHSLGCGHSVQLPPSVYISRGYSCVNYAMYDMVVKFVLLSIVGAALYWPLEAVFFPLGAAIKFNDARAPRTEANCHANCRAPA
jgi:hypothetical protein